MRKEIDTFNESICMKTEYACRRKQEGLIIGNEKEKYLI